jgi:hypothetical protein
VGRLRTMLLVVSLCAVVFAVLASHYSNAQRQRTAVDVLQRRGWHIVYESDRTNDWTRIRDVVEALTSKDFVSAVELVQIGNDAIPTDSDLLAIRQLRAVRIVSIVSWHSHVTDRGICGLAQVKGLETLIIHNSEITEQALECLAGNGSLRTLVITDARLGGSAVSALARFPNLKELHIANSCLTEHDEAQLVQALPSCTVTFDR